MWKTVAAGLTALAIAGGSMVYAQQRGDGRGHAPHWRPSAEDISAFTDARIAGFKAGLRLTADQEKNWPALETALRDFAKLRSERFSAYASADRPKDPVERLRLRADAMTQMGSSLKAIADAEAPLYQSLDDSQKHRFAIFAHMAERRFGQEHQRHHGQGGRGVMHGRGGSPAGPGSDEPADAPKPHL
jgi:zinc resistance-associated protein